MTRSQFPWLVLCLAALAVLAGYRLFGTPTAIAAPQPAGWEYQTASVDLGSLTPKLTELSRDGWEVFNVISVDTLIDQTPDGKTHILTQRVEVTAKRAK